MALHRSDAYELRIAQPREAGLVRRDQRKKRVVPLAHLVRQRAEHAAVESGAERRPLARDDDDTDAVGDLGADLGETEPSIRCLRISLERTSQGDAGDLAVDVVPHSPRKEFGLLLHLVLAQDAFLVRVAPPRPRRFAPDSLRMRCTKP